MCLDIHGPQRMNAVDLKCDLDIGICGLSEMSQLFDGLVCNLVQALTFSSE